MAAGYRRYTLQRNLHPDLIFKYYRRRVVRGKSPHFQFNQIVRAERDGGGGGEKKDKSVLSSTFDLNRYYVRLHTQCPLYLKAPVVKGNNIATRCPCISENSADKPRKISIVATTMADVIKRGVQAGNNGSDL